MAGRDAHAASIMTAQAMLWALAALATGVAVLGGLAEHRRASRRNLDRPGWVPWSGIQILGALVAVVAAALALHL
jgi:hypothetical protein